MHNISVASPFPNCSLVIASSANSVSMVFPHGDIHNNWYSLPAAWKSLRIALKSYGKVGLLLPGKMVS